ncbi:N-6 DNA methylase [Streptomyces sp. NPDC059985]|uniref:N-6 DNA methylase n=1 Tax=Streptomyces sp. NPDC059985 TaxID=3347025 RepID=UPI0036CA0C9B
MGIRRTADGQRQPGLRAARAASLRAGARAAVVMPTKAGNSGSAAEMAIRRAMVQAGVVECVIAMPAKLFSGTAAQRSRCPYGCCATPKTRATASSSSTHAASVSRRAHSAYWRKTTSKPCSVRTKRRTGTCRRSGTRIRTSRCASRARWWAVSRSSTGAARSTHWPTCAHRVRPRKGRSDASMRLRPGPGMKSNF